MIIKTITAHRIGPFYEPFTLELNKRVTILTGGNDVGKSSLLKAIELALGDGAADDAFINHDHMQESQKPWPKDETITVGAFVELTEAADLHGNGYTITEGDTLRIHRQLARDVVSTSSHSQLRRHGAGSNRLNLPAILKSEAGIVAAIRDEIDLTKPTQLEQALLDAAFKARFDYSRLAEMKSIHFTRAIRGAEDELNRLLEKVLPHPGMVRFDLRSVEGDKTKLAVLVRDRNDGITPFGSRGAGVRRMITLAAELITYHRSAHHRLIILDEPENSLHADAQHLLREFLYSLTSDGRTQVIYATHSASMVNPMRSEQLRVLVRNRSGTTATTKLLPRPAEENFLGLRTSLGISAADSLLFAPVTIITEGATEVGCLPLVVEKLETAGVLAVPDVHKLLGLCNFMDGMGDQYEFLCRLAKAHGARVVLFLDGDKRNAVARVREHHPEVPIVFLPASSEFEELVPAKVYLQALLDLTGEAYTEEIHQQLAAWTAEIPYRSRKAFSKRVEGWFTDSFDKNFPPKKILMQRAVTLAGPAEINGDPLRELLSAVRDMLSSTSFA